MVERNQVTVSEVKMWVTDLDTGKREDTPMVTREYLPAWLYVREICDVILMNHATCQFSSALSCVGCWNYQGV
jgi:hypothetical protein